MTYIEMLSRGRLTDCGCLEFVGATNSGYGWVNINGKNDRAHRHVWRYERGEVPDGLVVRHKCDNRLCMAIDHLEIGTKRDNYRDMIERGGVNPGKYQPTGYNHHNCKLSPCQVAEIRSLSGSKPQWMIGKQFGVSQITVSKIIRGVTCYE